MAASTDTLDHAALDALGEAVAGRVRTGMGDDAVAGVAVGAVVEPADTEQTAAVLKVAAERGMSVVARGTGTRMSWGVAPRSADVLVDLSRQDQVLEHEAGDLVVHVQAGARLDAVAPILAQGGQHLAVDPPATPGAEHPGTVGGAIATGASGPLRFSLGGVRDLLIGVTLVRADGVIARAGGKVVKNVAGYDLAKLVTGSWGTLAIVTEARFRLHPVAPASRWVSFSVTDPAAAHNAVQRVVHSQLMVAGLELDRPGDHHATLCVQVSGTDAGVDARVEELRALLAGAKIAAEPPPWWSVVPGQVGDTLLKLTHQLTGLPLLFDALDTATSAAGLQRADVRGSAGVGVLHARLRAEPKQVGALLGQLRADSAAWGGDVVVLDAPAAVRAVIDMWGPARGLPIMSRVKDQFDPQHRLAPGRFVGGI